MAAAPGATDERRGHRRILVALTAHCQVGSRYLREPVADLSQGGLYLRTRELAREGTPVRVALALPDEDGPRFCSLAGSVARVDRDARGLPRGLGVSFAADQIAPGDLATLARFVRPR